MTIYHLKPSRLHFTITLLVILIGFIILFLMPWKIFFKILSNILLLIYSLQFIYREIYLQKASAIMSIEPYGENHFRLYTNNNSYEAELRSDSVLTFLVMVLRFNSPHHPFPVSCTIFRDALIKDQYRQLLKTVRWG